MIAPEKKKEKFKTIKVSLAPVEKKLSQKSESKDKSSLDSTSSSLPAAPSSESAESVKEVLKKESSSSSSASSSSKALSNNNTVQTKKSLPPGTQSSERKTSTDSKAAKPSEKAPEVKQPVERKIKKSLEELAKEQMSRPKNNNSFSDDDFEYTESSSQKTSASSVKESSLSGSAASAGKETAAKSLSTSSSDGRVVNKSASSSTSSALSNLKAGSFGTTVAEIDGKGKVLSRTDIKVGSEGGKKTILVGGVARQLLNPSSPVIYLDEEAARLIDETRTVQIIFKVLANGRVPSSDITFKPSALLPSAVQDAIRAELSLWLFSTDPSGQSGTATFDYTIEVK